MTNEDISKIIALLDDAKMLCVKTQNEVSPLRVCVEEPGPIVERPVHPGAIQIYWAGCKGLAELARRLASSAVANSNKSAGLGIVSKIGLTQEKLEERLLVLGHDKYGSVHREDGREIARPGFERWVAQAIHVSREPRDAAIAMTARTIDVVLPPGMTRRQLDLGLRKALAPYILDAYGVECFTNYSGLDRLSRATELVIGPDPRDADFLLEIVEKILADHRIHVAHGASAAVPPQAHPPRARSAKAASHRRRAK